MTRSLPRTTLRLAITASVLIATVLILRRDASFATSQPPTEPTAEIVDGFIGPSILWAVVGGTYRIYNRDVRAHSVRYATNQELEDNGRPHRLYGLVCGFPVKWAAFVLTIFISWLTSVSIRNYLPQPVQTWSTSHPWYFRFGFLSFIATATLLGAWFDDIKECNPPMTKDEARQLAENTANTQATQGAVSNATSESVHATLVFSAAHEIATSIADASVRATLEAEAQQRLLTEVPQPPYAYIPQIPEDYFYAPYIEQNLSLIQPNAYIDVPCTQPGIGLLVCDTCKDNSTVIVIVNEPTSTPTSTSTDTPTFTPTATATLTQTPTIAPTPTPNYPQPVPRPRPLPIPQPTPRPLPPSPSQRVLLQSPPDGSHVTTDLVPFGWTADNLQLGPEFVFQIVVCDALREGMMCQPSRGITTEGIQSNKTTYSKLWRPGSQGGTYRWRVVIVPDASHSSPPLVQSRAIWMFTWDGPAVITTPKGVTATPPGN